MLAVLLLAAALMPQELPTPSGERAEAADVCDVVKDPAKYSGHRLELKGIVIGQQTDRLMLITGLCQFGVKLRFESSVEKTPQVKALFAAIHRGNPGTTDRDIKAVFTGVFVYTAEGSTLMQKVERVDHLEAPRR